MAASVPHELRCADRVELTWRTRTVYRGQVLEIQLLDVSLADIGIIFPKSLRAGDEVLLKLSGPEASRRSAYCEAFLTAVVQPRVRLQAPSSAQPPQAGDAAADIDRHEHPDASRGNEAD